MTFSVKPVLTGEKTLLRPFTVDDVPVMAEILADPEVLRLTGSPDQEFGPERLRSWVRDARRTAGQAGPRGGGPRHR